MTLTHEVGRDDEIGRRRWWVGRTLLFTGVLIIVAFALIRMASAIPPNAFYSGDCGVKLIAAQNAIRHPASPLTVDPPRASPGGPPAYMESFFVAHGDHAHAVQAPLFPLLTAPLVARFGLRAAYVLPALAFLALIVLVRMVARAAETQVSEGMIVAIAVIANPLVFYALELWEHVPAAAFLAGSTALVFGRDHRRLTLAAAGLVGGIASLIRPEAMWYVAALAVVVAMDRRDWRSVVYLLLGCAVAIAPFVVYNQLHFGAPAGPHLEGNFGGLWHDWLSERARLIGLWLVPNVSPSEVVGWARPPAASFAAWFALAGIGAAWLWSAWTRRHAGPPVLALLCAVVLATLAAGGWLNRESLWQACPVAVLAALPMSSAQRSRFWWALAILVAITTAGVVLSSPNDGGAQWGPRYLLIASPAIMLLAGLNATAIFRSKRVFAIVCVTVVLLASAYVSRFAYADLRGAKRYYARIVAQTDRLLPPGGYLVTDLWWFDQVTAALHDRGTMLFTGDEKTANQALRELDAAGVASVLVVRSRTESAGGSLERWPIGTRYSIGDAVRQKERELTYVRLERR